MVHRPFWSGLCLLSDHCPGTLLHSTTRGWPSFCALDKLSSFLPQGFSLAVALSGMFFLQIIPHLLSAEGCHLGSPLGQRCSLPRLLSVETLLECLLWREPACPKSCPVQRAASYPVAAQCEGTKAGLVAWNWDSLERLSLLLDFRGSAKAFAVT